MYVYSFDKKGLIIYVQYIHILGKNPSFLHRDSKVNFFPRFFQVIDFVACLEATQISQFVSVLMLRNLFL